MNQKVNKKAFSLIELIFVIVILGIISAIAVPKFLDSKSDALATTIKRDISTITTSIQSYNLLNGTISEISDAVDINEENWETKENNSLVLKASEKCIIINLENNKLHITVDDSINDKVCSKLIESGVKSKTYDLL